MKLHVIHVLGTSKTWLLPLAASGWLWMIPSPAAAQWLTNGGVLYYNGGPVALGTSAPSAAFEINGVGAPISQQWNIDEMLRISDAGANVHTGVVFDTGATGPAALRGFYVQKGGQQFNFVRFDSAGVAAPIVDMTITSAGRVGIGTRDPSADFQINGSGSLISSDWNISQMLRISDGGANTHTGVVFDTGATGTAALRGFYVQKGSQQLNFVRFDSAGVAVPAVDMTIASNGNVGIGTMAPQYPLSVNGTIQAKEVLVNTGWSDYVFEPNYKLMPLLQVATYIKHYHHLRRSFAGAGKQERRVRRRNGI